MATIAENRNRVAGEHWKKLQLSPGATESFFEELSYPEKQERVALYQQAAESINLGDLFTDVSFDQAVRELSDEERRDLQGAFDRINDSNDRFEWDADRQMRMPRFGELSLDEFDLAQGQARSDWKHLNPTEEELSEEQAAEWRKTQLPLDTPVPEDAAIDIQAIEEDAERLKEINRLKRDPVRGHGASVMRPPEPSVYVEEAGRHIDPKTGEYFTTEDEIVEYQKPGWGVEKAVAQSIAEAILPPGVAQAYDLAYFANETEKFSRGEVGWSGPALAGIAFLPLGDLLKIPGRVGAAMRRSLKNHPDNPIKAREEAMNAVNSSTRNIDPKTGIGDSIPGREERLHTRLDELSDDNRELQTLAKEDNAWKARNEGWETDPQYALQGEGTLGETGADILAGKSEVLDAEDISGLKAETADVELDLKQRTQATAARVLARENEAAKALSERVRQRDLDDIEKADDAATQAMADIEEAGAKRQSATEANTARLEQQARDANREVKAGNRASDRGEKAVYPGGPTRRPLEARTTTEPAVTKPEETGLAVPGDERLTQTIEEKRNEIARQFTPESARQASPAVVVEEATIGRPQLTGPAGQAPPDVTPAADLPPPPGESTEWLSFDRGAQGSLKKGREPKPAPDAESVDDAIRAASKLGRDRREATKWAKSGKLPRLEDLSEVPSKAPEPDAKFGTDPGSDAFLAERSAKMKRSRPPSEDATPDELAAWWQGQHELPIGEQDLAGMQRVGQSIVAHGGTQPKAWARPLIQPDSSDSVRAAEAADLLESGNVWSKQDPRGWGISKRDGIEWDMEAWIQRELSLPVAEQQMDTVRLFNERLENLSVHGWEGWSGAPARRTTGVQDIKDLRTDTARQALEDDDLRQLVEDINEGPLSRDPADTDAWNKAVARIEEVPAEVRWRQPDLLTHDERDAWGDVKTLTMMTGKRRSDTIDKMQAAGNKGLDDAATAKAEEPFPDWEDAPVSDDVAPAPQAKAATDKAAAAAKAKERANKRRAAGKYDSTDFELGRAKEGTVVNFKNSEGMFNPDDVSTVIRVQKTKKGDVLTIKDADGSKVQLYARDVRVLKEGRDLPKSAADAAEEALTARDVIGRAFKKRRIGPRTTAAVGVAGTLGGAVVGGVTLWNRNKDKKERTAMYDGLSTEFGMAPSLKYLPEHSNPFFIIEGEEITPRPMHFLLEELLDERGTKLTRDVVANATYEKFDDYIQDGDESKRFREMVGRERPTVATLIQAVEVLQSPELAEDKLTPAEKKKKKKWENEVRRTLRGFYTFDATQKARIDKQEKGE